MWKLARRVIVLVLVAWTSQYLLRVVAEPAAQDKSLTPVAIETLVADAARFDGKTVMLNGTVAAGVGIMGAGAFNLVQHTPAGTQTILIISNRGIPSPGKPLTIVGTFRQAFVIGAATLSVIISNS